MSTIKSSDEHLTLNADGSGNDIKFQSNGTEVASISDGGVVTATSFSGSGANLTGISSVGGATGVDFNDNVKARFGTGNDLEIYSDGDASFIKENGSSELYIRGTNIILKSGADNDDYIKCHENGDVKLYYSNAEKLATTSAGANVSGICKVNRTSTSAGANLQVDHTGASQYGLLLNSTNSGSGTHYHITITRQDTQAGYMVSSPTSIGLANSSDERLKENIQDSPSATQDIKNIKVRQFDWKNDRDVHRDYGFVAQELVSVVPEAVTVGSDELNEDGTPVQIWGVDDSKLIPRLVKTIQELEARITALEA